MIRLLLKAVIDFEEACCHPFIFDIGMAIIGSCTTNNEVTLEKVKVLVEGYQSVRKLNLLEKKSIQLFAIYGAVATSFWRFRQYHIIFPTRSKFQLHQEMVDIANFLHQIDNEDFVEMITT